MAAKKLSPYFRAHIIIIITSYPIIAILHKPDTLGRLLKRVIELSEFDILYRPKSTDKGQVLTDFIAKISDMLPHDISELLWILETDGSPKVVGGAGMILQSVEGLLVTHAIKFSFSISNNEAEYKAIFLRLRVAKELSVLNLELRCDS